MALSCLPRLCLVAIVGLLKGRLLGGVCSDDFPKLRESVPLRCAGMEKEVSPLTSLAAAANAATFVLFCDTLFLRVTRWLGFREPVMELLFLVCDRPLKEPEFEMESR